MIHYMRIRSSFNEIFNKPQKVDYCDVNLNVMKRFDECNELDKEFFKILAEYFKLDFKDDLEKDFNKEDCIESLGIFISPDIYEYIMNDKYVSNIFLAPSRIKRTANKFNLTFLSLYNFVRIHERAHSMMSPEVMLKKETRYVSKDFYLFFEEMLATLYALFMFKKHLEIKKIRNFVSNQPIQYKAAFFFDEKRVEPMMITWLLFKADELPKTTNDLYYEYIDLEFMEKLVKIDKYCLEVEISDLLIKDKVKISEVQRKLKIGYNKAACLLEKLYEYGRLKINKKGEFYRSV